MRRAPAICLALAVLAGCAEPRPLGDTAGKPVSLVIAESCVADSTLGPKWGARVLAPDRVREGLRAWDGRFEVASGPVTLPVEVWRHSFLDDPVTIGRTDLSFTMEPGHSYRVLAAEGEGGLRVWAVDSRSGVVVGGTPPGVALRQTPCRGGVLPGGIPGTITFRF